ncbi:MAG TPA: hypothetical protein VNJ04_05070 [Gemmatimonadaceae bacterium]|nr:hypothetical protein [Gemmatimonadaceae bacterium]
MADRESVHAWLSSVAYRFVHANDPRREIVERLIAEGKAKWSSPVSDRVVALPARRPTPSPPEEP